MKIKFNTLSELHILHDMIIKNFSFKERVFNFNVYNTIYEQSYTFDIEINTNSLSSECINIYTYSITNSIITGKVQSLDVIINPNFVFQLFDTGVMNGKYILKGSIYDESKKEFGNSYILIEINSTNDFNIKESK